MCPKSYLYIYDFSAYLHLCPSNRSEPIGAGSVMSRFSAFYIRFHPEGHVSQHNGHPCKTTGIDSIKLHKHDGTTKLKKNLISLGALESKGLVVMMRDGVLKETSRVLVMLKGVRKNIMDYHHGNTVVGTVAKLQLPRKTLKQRSCGICG